MNQSPGEPRILGQVAKFEPNLTKSIPYEVSGEVHDMWRAIETRTGLPWGIPLMNNQLIDDIDEQEPTFQSD